MGVATATKVPVGTADDLLSRCREQKRLQTEVALWLRVDDRDARATRRDDDVFS
jgi:hypothetical protein